MNYTKKYHIEELECNECREQIIENLEKLSFIKNVNIDYDHKDLLIESDKELNEVEFKQVLNAILVKGHCHEHKFNHIQDVVTEEYECDDLHCAGCAIKIEKELNKNEDVLNAQVNFSTKRIIIRHMNNVEVYDIVSKIVSNIDSNANPHKIEEKCCDGCSCHHDHNHNHEANKPYKFVLFFVGVLFTILGIIFEHTMGIFALYLPLYIAGYLLIGYDIIYMSFKEMIHGDIFNENMLMVIASIGSFVLAEFSEAIMVMFLFKIGEYFQDRAADKSRDAIKELMNLNIEYVTLKDGTLKYVKDVNVGEIISVKVGERIPLDGKISKGNTNVDMKALTGESMPTFKELGSEILSGSINLTKVIEVEVTKKSSESTISKVMKLVEEASNHKSKTEQFIYKFARIYTPIVLIIAVLVGMGKYFLFDATIVEALNSLFTILVISCPCALVISIPLGYFSGIGCASKNGILIKGGNFLEALSKVDTFVFDKTGTITKGNFAVEKVYSAGTLSDDEIIDYIASAEQFSLHPIAKAIEDKYHKAIKYDAGDVEEISGAGLKVNINGYVCLVGNDLLLDSFNIVYTKANDVGTTVYLARDNKYEGYITIKDEIKPQSVNTISYLKKNNYKTIMLTGDSMKVAEDVAKIINIDEYKYKLLPEDKYNILKDIIDKDHKHIAYVGDGINDAPSLSIADVGIAMGGVGSDSAKECADIVIMNDDISKIKSAIKISKQTKKIILQNIIFALIIKILALIIGALGILSSFGMVIAVFSDVGVCLLAILNVLRILKYNPQKKTE